LVIRRDGSMWAAGHLPENLLGENFRRLMTTNWVRIGHGSDWAGGTIDGMGSHTVALKKSGVFFESDAYQNTLFSSGYLRKPSKNKDWIAVSESWGSSLALASDGTLSCWIQLPEESAGGRKLLGPTRRPFWSL